MKKILALAFLCSAAASAETVRYLDEMPLETMTSGMRTKACVNKSVVGTPLRLGSADGVCVRGVGAHAENVYVLKTDGRVQAFDATVGLDWSTQELPPSWDTGHGWGGAIFRVYADGKPVAETPVLKPGGQPAKLHADLAGAKTIVLEATDSGDCFGMRFARVNWVDARFTCADGATLEPTAAPLVQLGILTPAAKKEPVINTPGVFGVRPGHEVLLRVATAGERPMTFSAFALPAGVTLDAERGILTGTAPTTPGDYSFIVTASNAFGRVSKTIRLAVGRQILLTPPLGWNSWNIHNSSVKDADIRAAADGMDRSGLGDHGWCYLNIDDGWSRKTEPFLDANGAICPNEKFPDMKALGDHIHAYGFKFGIYSSPGPKTCGGFTGSYGHEAQDAQAFASWGIDYLKHDWCSYGGIFDGEVRGRSATEADYAKPYRVMSRNLEAQSRDIVHAFCQYGMGGVVRWGRDAGAQVYRSHGDLKDSWPAMMKAVDTCADETWRHAGPSFWCDPDMMVLGYLDTDKGMHWSDLTPNEQYTHVSMWTMLAAPMLLGCDLNKIDAFTKNLLVNDEVLAVHQDLKGAVARRVLQADGRDLWVRPLADGSHAVAIVNRYPFVRRLGFTLAELGLSGVDFACRDLWRQQDLGAQKDGMAFDIPGHATVLLKITRDCAGCAERGK